MREGDFSCSFPIPFTMPYRVMMAGINCTTSTRAQKPRKMTMPSLLTKILLVEAAWAFAVAMRKMIALLTTAGNLIFVFMVFLLGCLLVVSCGLPIFLWGGGCLP